MATDIYRPKRDGPRPMCRGDRWCVVHTYKQNSGDSAAARSGTHMIFIKFHIFGVFFRWRRAEGVFFCVLGGFLGPLALYGAVLGLEEGVTIATNARKLGG